MGGERDDGSGIYGRDSGQGAHRTGKGRNGDAERKLSERKAGGKRVLVCVLERDSQEVREIKIPA